MRHVKGQELAPGASLSGCWSALLVGLRWVHWETQQPPAGHTNPAEMAMNLRTSCTTPQLYADRPSLRHVHAADVRQTNPTLLHSLHRTAAVRRPAQFLGMPDASQIQNTTLARSSTAMQLCTDRPSLARESKEMLPGTLDMPSHAEASCAFG